MTTEMTTEMTYIYIEQLSIKQLLRIPISEQTKQEIVAKWLSGWPRDKIAGERYIACRYRE